MEPTTLGQVMQAEDPPTREAFWSMEGLFVIADAIRAKRGDADLLVNASQSEDFVCPTFSMRSYCGCEGTIHAGGCPPNFEYPRMRLYIFWSKHAGHEHVANAVKPPGLLWELAVAECIRAVAEWKA